MNSRNTRSRRKFIGNGVRVFELIKGKNGYGFTLSGQMPCILNCIIPGSSAEHAGLRPGDCLLGVNKDNVCTKPHDNVVQLIAKSTGILTLHIRENYISSDSSDEEDALVNDPQWASRPRYPLRYRRAKESTGRHSLGGQRLSHRRGQRIEQGPGHKSNKSVMDLVWKNRLSEIGCHQLSSIERLPLKSLNFSRYFDEDLKASSSRRCSQFSDRKNDESFRPFEVPSSELQQHSETLFRSVIGYLGTIEMPKEPRGPGSRLQSIQNCIRRLGIEKKIHTTVLMALNSRGIVLSDQNRITLAEFSSDRINFCGIYGDDKNFFGLVVRSSVVEDEFNEPNSSSSCHVFMVDPRIINHNVHELKAQMFGFRCTSGADSCQEFPTTADSILGAIKKLYTNKLDASVPNHYIFRNSQLHVSHHSNCSSNCSNSDSGIGFRDEINPSVSSNLMSLTEDTCHRSLERNTSLAPLCRLRQLSLSHEILPSDCLHKRQSGHLSLDRVPYLKNKKDSSFNTECNAQCDPTNVRFKLEESLKRIDIKDQDSVSVQLSDVTSSKTDSSGERPVDVGRVGIWAYNFENLLADSAGLHAFTEFLKMEFSSENLHFWLDCENFRKLTDIAKIKLRAKEIHHKYLSFGASEHVNVDSHVKLITEISLVQPNVNMFISAQKQIYNLMKFDSYRRFLESTIFKECLKSEMSGKPLPTYCDAHSTVKTPSHIKPKRRSIIPWYKTRTSKARV